MSMANNYVPLQHRHVVVHQRRAFAEEGGKGDPQGPDQRQHQGNALQQRASR